MNQYIDLDQLAESGDRFRKELEKICATLYQEKYENDQRLVFQITCDTYHTSTPVGLRLQTLQRVLNEIDISNFFVVIKTSNPDIEQELAYLNQHVSSDPVPLSYEKIDVPWVRLTATNTYSNYQYGSSNPVKISLNDLNSQEHFLLTESKVFCILPWIHLHAWPTGEVYPCCFSVQGKGLIGDCKQQTLEEIWNGPAQSELRRNMLTEKETTGCSKCYEQERSGFFSGRQSANKHHGHNIDKVSTTNEQGQLDKFEMTYWDIRFSNLCNLRCRSCGHIFSSQWYQDQAKLAGPEWAKNNRVLNIAGRDANDMWNQLLPHIDYVEQIYFAGGEPMIMDEHYRILEELERRGRFDVRLSYNTNFTEVKLKDRLVFDYWKKFKEVSVGASLDDMGPRGEYIRKGTNWAQVERNREKMLEICPNVDFYVSATLSIFNAQHLPEFHRNWTERGLIRAQDFNVNILQDPQVYRIDIAPTEYKERITKLYQEHLLWLAPLDKLQRASRGFESAITFMNQTDNSHLIDKFWDKTNQLDQIRNENVLTVIPELSALK